MPVENLSRREFIRSAAVVAGASVIAPFASRALYAADDVKRTATDIVTLNKTGLRLSRVGIGTGVNNGEDNFRAGKEAFIKTIRYAYDKGIRYFDCAQRYTKTFATMGEALKGLPREQMYIQSKIWPGDVPDVMAAIDKHRKNFNSDYVDSMLIHCRTEGNWTELYKAMMDTYDEAQSKGWIKARGVSCHSVAALQQAGAHDWPQVHLVRTNPQGIIVDGPDVNWSAASRNPVQPATDQIKIMHDKGRGVIGMKMFGNGFITDPAEREKSLRFNLSNPHIDAIVMGMCSPKEIDENLAMVNRILADLPATT